MLTDALALLVTIFTVGHSTRTIDELAELLRAHGVKTVVDIRSIRRSRTNPQFNADRIARSLKARGLGYRVIEALGGRRGKAKQPPALANDAWQVTAFRNYADYALTPEFRAGLAELIALGKRTPVAIMCAEAVWWRCHRRIVADHLIAKHACVVHLMSKTKAEPATLTPFAQVVRGRVHYPRPRRARAPGSARR